MKTTSLLSLSYLLLILLIVSSCGGETKNNNNDISTDEAVIAAGQSTFEMTCGACHNFMQAGIGPQLGGLTKEVSADWIKKFIKNPQEMIDSGDERSVALFKKFNSYMPSFSYLSDEQIDQVIAYINTKE
ncbi:MAG: cytochrome c, partial [Imperialibacter sp.]